MITDVSGLLDGLIQRMPDAIIVTNKVGVIEIANNKVVDVFGYTPEEILGKEIEILVPVSLREKHRNHVREYFTNPLDKKMAAHRKVMGLRKDGSEFEIDITLAALSLDNKLYAISSSRDISDKKHLEELLQMENAGLQLMNKSLEKYSYTITHDLKAPLARIEGLIELMIGEIREGKPVDQLELTHQYLMDSIAAMRFLINKELEEAKRKQSGKEVNEISFPELFGEIKNLITIPAKFEFKLSGCGTLSFSGKKILFIQVLLNLLSNAIKYNDKEKGYIEISCSDLGSEYLFSLSDNGPGIPENEKENIFKLFEKHSQSIQSHGVGLNTVKSILEARGGRIWVKSKFGEGAKFEFLWPKKELEK
ncbi:MAG: PAS domain-containing sensor histidine kinase [Sporocytophaga sp.]|nr:PAS domain-containing sensor histidine kinase [Sporocytophaga sp.]